MFSRSSISPIIHYHCAQMSVGSADTPTRPLRIVITGVAGHVGSVIAKWAVANGHTVLGLDHVPFSDRVPPSALFTYKACDLCDYVAFRDAVAGMEGCEAIIHIAGVFNRTGEKQWHAQQRFRPDVG
jgi:nucleoside-diphosphate-sugar epimerase